MSDTTPLAGDVEDDIWHECAHPETDIRSRVTAAGIVIYGVACLVCGRWVRQIKKREWTSEQPPLPYDDTLEERFYQARREWWEQRQHARAAAEAARQQEWWDAYTAYLQTPQWKAKRHLVLERAGGVCEGCGMRPPTQVHHRTYEHVGDEFLFELVAVCQQCHERIHPHMQQAA